MSEEVNRNPRKVLGKGLSALLPTRPATKLPEHEIVTAPPAPRPALPEHFEEFQSIALTSIQPGGQQPREMFDLDKLMELTQSIKANGVLQPIIVHRAENGRYKIVAGERRWRAAGLAGLKEIPALVRTVDSNRLLELSLIENIQREDLNAIEVATAFYRLAADHGLSHEQIAERTGKDRSTVTNFLRLLKLGERVQNELRSGAISVGHARALLNLTDEDQQAQICQKIIANKLSVRDVEGLVKHLTDPRFLSQVTENKDEAAPVDANVRAALEEIQMALGTRVKLVAKANGAGRLEIEYYSADDLDRIYSVIVKQ